MSTQLTIDTTKSDTAYVAIEHDGTVIKKKTLSVVQKAQMVLPLIADLLKENHMSFTDIQKICVIDAQGSLTGTRVGFAIGNALGFLLDIPVNGATPPATPHYEDKWSQ